MNLRYVSINITVNLNELIDQIADIFGVVFNNFERSNFCEQSVGGGRFISKIEGGIVVAAYNHPRNRHSATADGGLFGGGIVKSIAEPGEWAIVGTKAGIKGRKTYWNNETNDN